MRWLIALLWFVLAVAATYALLRAGVYGLTMFVLDPIFVGAIGAWAVRPATAVRAANAGGLSTAIALGLLLPLRMEGALCILMALPLAVPLGMLGGWLFFRAESSRAARRGVTMLLLLPIGSLTWDLKARPPVFQVHSVMEIAAPPELVWKNTVTFSRLPEPREWYFRAGIAYPQAAGIIGAGVGATRYCQFSTGPFVEPVEVWDEPHRLEFSVTQNPPPMREWGLYAHLEPKHLRGYMVAVRGEFELTELANHHTELAATTWYRHGLWPAEYWRWWSDAIIHRIHLRVLDHIRTLSEAGDWW